MRYICFNKRERIKPVWAWHTICKKGFESPVNSVNNAWLFLGHKGAKHFKANDREYLLEHGTFYVAFPDTLTSCIVKGAEQSDFCLEFVLPKDYFIVEADSIDEVYDPELCVLPEFSRVNDCEKYLVIFSQLVDAFHNRRINNNFKEEICDNYTKILLCSLSNAVLHHSGETNRRVSTEKIFQWLGQNARKGIGANDAAKALNYNADYLNHIVKSETGMTLTKYLNALRIDEAKTLLSGSNMNISQIAFAVGFSDEKYFMRIFRQQENVTPSQYRSTYFWKNTNE